MSKFVDKTYVLLGKTKPLTYSLISRDSSQRGHARLLKFDEAKEVNRSLRYASNHASPYMDEQSGELILDKIIFMDGVLHVPRENQNLQNFLAIHPLNGKKFKELNKAKDAEEELANYDRALDAEMAVKGMPIEKLQSVARLCLEKNVDNIPSSELKRDMRIFAKTYPDRVLELMDSPKLQHKADVELMFDKELVSVWSKDKPIKFIHYNLKNNKSRIATVPEGEEPIEFFKKYLQTDEGMTALEVLEAELV